MMSSKGAWFYRCSKLWARQFLTQVKPSEKDGSASEERMLLGGLTFCWEVECGHRCGEEGLLWMKVFGATDERFV